MMNIDSDSDSDSVSVTEGQENFERIRPDPPQAATSGESNKNEGSGEQDSAAAAKRRAIQEIMRDKSLTELDRRLRIQALMDGTSQIFSSNNNNSSIVRNVDGIVGSLVSSALPEETITCVHYNRKCNIIAPCCQRVFGCRICHDELTPSTHGPMNRFAIEEIICKDCHTQQGVSNQCIKCGVQFGEYYCDVCKLWMSNESKKPFHCPDCGFCRVGGRENFRHCQHCCMCISVSVYDNHNCMKDKYKNNCPVCREDMFSSRQSPQDLPCGHAIHAHCFRKLAAFDYRCPICKKTVVSQQSMAAAWFARARDIEMQPMPPDLARVVNIMCNDCENKSFNRNWHFLGVQCPQCSSFNTVVEQVVSSGSEAGSNTLNL